MAVGKGSRWRQRQVLLWFACAISWAAAVGLDAPLLRAYFPASGFHLALDLACFRDNGAWLGRHLAAAAGGAARTCAYKYPPPFLFLATPLSFLTPLQAFVGWSIISVLCLAGAAWTLGWPWRALALAVLSPPGLLCLSIGESGIIISALLLLALGLAETAPVAAGIAAGAMVMKPQLGLLLPVCYAAARNLRAFASAMVTAACVCGLSALLFGGGVWVRYAHQGMEATRATLAAPWPQRDQHLLVTPYIFLHSLGAGFAFANLAQLVATVLAAVAAWQLWRGPPTTIRLPATLCLAALATPFACLYDLPALALAVAVEGGGALAWFWIFSGLGLFISVFSIAVGAPCLAVLFWILRCPRRQELFFEKKNQKTFAP